MKDKKQIIHELCFITIFILMLSLILFFMISGSGKSREAGLKAMTEKVLKDHVLVDYTIGDMIPVQTPIAVSSAVFELKKTDFLNSAPAYAVLIRAYGIAGALPLVYVFDGQDAIFAGIGGLENETVSYTNTGLFGYGLTTPVINFWQQRAQALLPQKEPEETKGATK